MGDALVNDMKRLHVLAQSDNSNMDEQSGEPSCQSECSNKALKCPQLFKSVDAKPAQKKGLHGIKKYSPQNNFIESDDSRSSVEDNVQYCIVECSSRTDSDEIKGTWNKNHLPWRPCTVPVVESDSFNENFHPSQRSKRKRKFKRMPVCVDPNPNIEADDSIPNILVKSKWSPFKKIELRRYQGQQLPKDSMKNFSPHRLFVCKNAWKKDMNSCERFCGKRKRGIRDKQAETKVTRIKNFADSSVKCCTQSSLMECDMALHNMQREPSSSSESECGIMTNDEGREGDDEHSDCLAERLSPPRILSDEVNCNSLFRRCYDNVKSYGQKMSQFEPNASAPWKKREIMCGKRRLIKYRPSSCQSVKEESLINELMQFEISSPERMQEGHLGVHAGECLSPMFDVQNNSSCPVHIPDQELNSSTDLIPKLALQQKLTRKRLCGASQKSKHHHF